MGLVIWLGFHNARKAGASLAREKSQEGLIENVDKAKRALHRLDADPEYRRRLRERHRRE
jgi:hypothetical protein